MRGSNLIRSSIALGLIAFSVAQLLSGNDSFVKDVSILLLWSFAQWTPCPAPWRQSLKETAWRYWEGQYFNSSKNNNSFHILEVPTVNVQEHLHDLPEHLLTTFGPNWRERPLLLKGLWSTAQLQNTTRRLSVQGLLQEDLSIPYFGDARKSNALSPDQTAPVREIVARIQQGAPHKIGTQLLVEAYPELVYEIAPIDLVTELFGNYFTPSHVQGSGPGNIFPAMTTVPVFIANGKQSSNREKPTTATTTFNDSPLEKMSTQPYTALHCEPIGNVAVQLSGQKRWTLVQPHYSHYLRPSIAPDYRAFFASYYFLDKSSSSDHHGTYRIPTYSAITAAGDAIWIPTWTWHRVDYVDSTEMAIGGSLFHFRTTDFFRNNPLFAIMIIPALLLELIGYNTQ